MPDRRRKAWQQDDDDRLLQRRICDLGLRLQDTPVLQRRIDRLRAELDARGLDRFRPHFWLSSEWFSPDGIPGVAIPFYLAHPRLTRLEEQQMHLAEGASETQCMKILRHEAGHAIDTAYRLSRRARWRELFGSRSTPYPQTYRPRPGSREHVNHLPAWYAQAHPAEDFAETFAVWLGPANRWRKQYAGWPALKKLTYVDELMTELQGMTAPIRTRKCIEPVRELRTTLAEHYEQRRAHYDDALPDIYDAQLRRLFSDDPQFSGAPSAAALLRQSRRRIRSAVSRWTGMHPYAIDQVLQDLIDRCRTLKLRLAVDQAQAMEGVLMMLAVHITTYKYTGHHPVAL